MLHLGVLRVEARGNLEPLCRSRNLRGMFLPETSLKPTDDVDATREIRKLVTCHVSCRDRNLAGKFSARPTSFDTETVSTPRSHSYRYLLVRLVVTEVNQPTDCTAVRRAYDTGSTL